MSIFEEGQVLLFDKPLYWTSFDLVNKVRNMLKPFTGGKRIKVGHAGTLDPLATGLMIICTGKATKRISEFMDLDKEYMTTIHMGETTPSFDMETAVDATFPYDHITREMAEKVLESFKGVQEQIPPIFSAKFIEGKRAYEFARQGKERELPPVKINIREAELTDFSLPDLSIRLLCSKGTYIRSFARDYGIALKSGGCLVSLKRISIGPYSVINAYSVEKFSDYLQQMKQI